MRPKTNGETSKEEPQVARVYAPTDTIELRGEEMRVGRVIRI